MPELNLHPIHLNFGPYSCHLVFPFSIQAILFFLFLLFGCGYKNGSEAQNTASPRTEIVSIKKVPFSDGSLINYSRGHLGFISAGFDSVAFVGVSPQAPVFFSRIPPVPDTGQCTGNLIFPFGFDGDSSWLVCDGGWRFIGKVKNGHYHRHVYLGGIPHRSGPDMEGLSVAEYKVTIQGDWVVAPLEITPISMDRSGYQNQPALALWNWKNQDVRWFSRFPSAWFGTEQINRRSAGFYGAVSVFDSVVLLGREGHPDLVRFEWDGTRRDSSSRIPDCLNAIEERQPRKHQNRKGKLIHVYRKTEFLGIFERESHQGWVTLAESGDGCFDLWYFSPTLSFEKKIPLSENLRSYLGYEETTHRLVFLLTSPEKTPRIAFLRMD